MASQFPGFSEGAMAFFRELKKNNTREWFQARKHVYEESVKAPMAALVEAINEEMSSFAPQHRNDPGKAIYRIYRDTRFSADKTPYKTHIAAVFPRRGMVKHTSAGYYFSVSPEEVEVAGGVYMPGPPQLLAIRSHVAGHFEQFQGIAAGRTLTRLMGPLQGNKLARVPKGFHTEHPAADILRHKQLYYYVVLDPALATSPRLLPEVVRRFRAMAPMVDFLNAPLQANRQRAFRDNWPA